MSKKKKKTLIKFSLFFIISLTFMNEVHSTHTHSIYNTQILLIIYTQKNPLCPKIMMVLGVGVPWMVVEAPCLGASFLDCTSLSQTLLSEVRVKSEAEICTDHCAC